MNPSRMTGIRKVRARAIAPGPFAAQFPAPSGAASPPRHPCAHGQRQPFGHHTNFVCSPASSTPRYTAPRPSDAFSTGSARLQGPGGRCVTNAHFTHHNRSASTCTRPSLRLGRAVRSPAVIAGLLGGILRFGRSAPAHARSRRAPPLGPKLIKLGRTAVAGKVQHHCSVTSGGKAETPCPATP